MTKLWISGTAKYSEDKKHRFLLTRDFDAGVGTVLFIGLNPSTATEEIDDPTVRRCIGFSIAWGHRKLIVANVFSLRSTDPKALYGSNPPNLKENDAHLLEAAKEASVVVAAWGVHGGLLDRDKEVLSILRDIKLHCLGETKEGFPRHPLYLASSSKLKLYGRRISA